MEMMCGQVRVAATENTYIGPSSPRTATLPLVIHLSTLMVGENEILLTIVGSEGSSTIFRFTLNLGKKWLRHQYYCIHWFFCCLLPKTLSHLQHQVQVSCFDITFQSLFNPNPMFVVNPALPFNPQCGVVRSDDDTAYIVNCAAPSGTQAIAQARYSVNGVDRGSGTERHLAMIMTQLSSFSVQPPSHWRYLFRH